MKRFILQWHITAECDYYCQHCYMHESESYNSERNNILPLTKCIDLINDFIIFTNKLSKRFNQNILPMINFSGGDPLIRSDFFDILAYANKNNIRIGILGNPTHINKHTSNKLKELGVKKYQLSLDGLKNTHDKLRKLGSFDQTIKAIDHLKNANIETHIMFTLSKSNKDDLIPLMELMTERKVDKFIFARISEVGKGKNLELSLSPEEYRQLLMDIHLINEKHKLNKTKTQLVLKDHLWKLLHYELGIMTIDKHNKKVMGGCGIGINFMVILANGWVYACRRFPSMIGNVNNNSLYDIFIYSKELNKYREHHLLEKCANCELLNYCRGCPAVSYGHNNNYFSPDPQCWKK